MKPPAFQFYPDDFIGGTATMNHEERGFYILALCVQWSKGGISKDEFARLGRGLVEPSLNHVSTKFEPGPDGLLRNARLETERAKQTEYRRLQSEKGKASVEARFNRGSTEVKPAKDLVSTKAQPEANSPSPSPSPSPTGRKEEGEGATAPARNKFEIPTLESVKLAMAKAGGSNSEAEKFWHYYEMCGWMVGKNKPMKNWLSAVAGWIVRNRETRNGSSFSAHASHSTEDENIAVNPVTLSRKGETRTHDEVYGSNDRRRTPEQLANRELYQKNMAERRAQKELEQFEREAPAKAAAAKEREERLARQEQAARDLEAERA